MVAVCDGDLRECVALARFGLLTAPVDTDSDCVLRFVINDFNPAAVTFQYKLQQDFLIERIEIFTAMLKA